MQQFAIGDTVRFGLNVAALVENAYLRRLVRVYSRNNWTVTVLALRGDEVMIQLLDEQIWVWGGWLQHAVRQRPKPAEVAAEVLTEVEP